MADIALNLQLTADGLAAVAAAHGMGVAAKITHVALGDATGAAGYVPDGTETELVNERVRVELEAGGALGPRQVLLQGTVPAGGDQFFIREMGYFLEDGTLLAIWSAPADVLGWVGGETPWFFKLIFAWAALPDGAVTVIFNGDAGDAAMALDLAQLEAKVRHTVEAAGVVWADLTASQLTDAIRKLTPADMPFLAGWGADGAGEDLTVQTHGAMVVPRAMKLTGCVGRCGTAPVGADIIIDISRNGVSVFTTKPKIVAGDTVVTAGVLNAAQVTCAAGDLIRFRILQVGTDTKGDKLVATVLAVLV
jgi:hypothetical protein